MILSAAACDLKQTTICQIQSSELCENRVERVCSLFHVLSCCFVPFRDSNFLSPLIFMKARNFLAILLIAVATAMNANAQKTEITISLNEQFFDSLVDS